MVPKSIHYLACYKHAHFYSINFMKNRNGSIGMITVVLQPVELVLHSELTGLSNTVETGAAKKKRPAALLQGSPKNHDSILRFVEAIEENQFVKS